MKLILSITRLITITIDQLPKIVEKLRRRIILVYRQIRQRGKEHLTVMFIPHSEKRIFTLHISYFTVIFVLILFILAATFSTIALLSHTTTQQEVSNLIERSKLWQKTERLLKQEIEAISENVDNLKPEIERLYTLASSSKEGPINLWAKGGISSDSQEELEELIEHELKLPEEIYYLKQINQDVKLTYKYIEHIKHFLEEREKVFSKIPSIWPLKVGGYITSDYGWRRHPFNRRRMEWHRGIDIAAWPGAPVIATAEGTVIFAGWRAGYGLTVIIRHEYGFETHYAHLSRIRTRVGKKVKRGTVVGYVGRTGLTTGYHLHYEIRIGLKDVNPWPYIMNIK